MALVAGCGGSEGPPPKTLPRALVTAMDHEGRIVTVPADAIIDPETGASKVERVRAWDKSTNQETWVAAEELVAAPSARSRYIPISPPEQR
jgi:hypothetical protein